MLRGARRLPSPGTQGPSASRACRLPPAGPGPYAIHTLPSAAVRPVTLARPLPRSRSDPWNRAVPATLQNSDDSAATSTTVTYSATSRDLPHGLLSLTGPCGSQLGAKEGLQVPARQTLHSDVFWCVFCSCLRALSYVSARQRYSRPHILLQLRRTLLPACCSSAHVCLVRGLGMPPRVHAYAILPASCRRGYPSLDRAYRTARAILFTSSPACWKIHEEGIHRSLRGTNLRPVAPRRPAVHGSEEHVHSEDGDMATIHRQRAA